MNAQLIVVRLNTMGRKGNESFGPFEIGIPEDIRPRITRMFDTLLKGIQGYVLVKFGNKLWQCERNAADPNRPYVRNEITYHPLAERFVSRSIRPMDVRVKLLC